MGNKPMNRRSELCHKLIFAALALIVGLTEVTAADKNTSASKTVEIELSEWNVKLSNQHLTAGNITFTAYNRGKEVHELVVTKLKDDKINSGQLPVNQHGSIDEDNMSFGEIIGEIEDIKAGKKVSKVFSLKPGRYALICNILEKEPDGSMEAHYAQGMHAMLVVE